MKVWVLEREFGYFKEFYGYRSLEKTECTRFEIYSNKNEANLNMKRSASEFVYRIDYQLSSEAIIELLMGIINESGVFALDGGTLRKVFGEKEKDSVIPAFVFEKNMMMIPMDKAERPDGFHYLTLTVYEKDVIEEDEDD